MMDALNSKHEATNKKIDDMAASNEQLIKQFEERHENQQEKVLLQEKKLTQAEKTIE